MLHSALMVVHFICAVLIVVLVLISRNPATIRLNSPASLGQPFRPDR